MEFDKAKFTEKLKGLVAFAQKKKNALEYQEIHDYFHDMPLNVEQMEKVFGYLEANGIDVDVGSDDVLPPVDDLLPEGEDLADIEEISEEEINNTDALMEPNYQRYDKFHIWDFVGELKSKGLIKHFGFSFHAEPKLLDSLLTAHPEVDFVQLQINYADWENRFISSRANYEVARKHNKSIVIMEPVKGGSLANPPKEVKKLFSEYAPDASYASWAIRFAASLDGVITVLSGMSNREQMADNISYMRDFKPLSSDEQKIIQQAQRIIGRSSTVPCTACRYCMHECPKQIPIPEIFSAWNMQLGSGQTAEALSAYKEATSSVSPADCVKCGKCEAACPQHIDIRAKLSGASEALGEK